MVAPSIKAETGRLLEPIKIGDLLLKHRIALAPLTRMRASADNIPQDVMRTYYEQRSSTPGTLIISEANLITERAVAFPNMPAIGTDVQVAAWKKITDAVHAQGCFIFCQIVVAGRANRPAPGDDYIVGPSNIPKPGGLVPRPLTIEEIHEHIREFGRAAKNAIRAGFDGIELHNAHGYLLDQFLHEASNDRTDDYGGSIEKRTRFGREVVQSVVDAIGESRTAIRFSPWAVENGLGEGDPIPTFTHFIKHLAATHPNLAYIHLVEPRFSGISDVTPNPNASNDFARDIWYPRPYITSGGFSNDIPGAVAATLQRDNELVAFGRMFISNPDLPHRIRENIPLTPYDRSTFYKPGPQNTAGYIDYPFAHL